MGGLVTALQGPGRAERPAAPSRAPRLLKPGRVPALRRLPQMMRRVQDDVVLFGFWNGCVADNPRAISEELHRRGAPLEQVWLVADGSSCDLPEWATIVRPGTRRHLEALGRARYVIANTGMPVYWRKKRGTTYVQTWHGTPLKRIAFDVERPSFRDSDRYYARLSRDVAKWDYLLSPNAFSTEVLRRAFRYDGEVLETGYPRNDALANGHYAALRASTRHQLGLADDQRAVLYAPTWRDNDAFSTELDLAAVADALGDDVVILVRAHPLVAGTVARIDHPRVRDVSWMPDSRELLGAADVLVTDYSSMMFDFAVTRKPMVFFTYDLEVYRDDLRGFTFDFEADAPGPLLRSTDEVIAALSDLPEVQARYARSYERFAERFCHLDDGRAAERVADTIFAG